MAGSAKTNNECITLAEVREKLARGDSLALVDVRSPEEFTAGHIDGAINIPVDALTAELTRLRAAPAVVTVCTSGGGRSERAAQILRASGLSVVRSLCGGVRGWQEQLMHVNGGSS